MANNPVPAADDRGVDLVRGELLREPLGGRTWRGALANRTGGLCLQVAVEIRFLDGSGATVGGLVRRADRLAPGSELDLQSRLPPEAAEARLHTLRWTRAGEPPGIEAGPPYPPRGYSSGIATASAVRSP